jgi:hypothetical protein
MYIYINNQLHAYICTIHIQEVTRMCMTIQNIEDAKLFYFQIIYYTDTCISCLERVFAKRTSREI